MRRRARRTAPEAWTCECGRTCRGNGGISSHRRACRVHAEHALAAVEQELARIASGTEPKRFDHVFKPQWEAQQASLRRRLGLERAAGRPGEPGPAIPVPGKTRNEQTVAAYLQEHPGERLRFEHIAAAVQLSAQQASIALSGLLRDGALPGLARVGRGTYQWDPPGPAPGQD